MRNLSTRGFANHLRINALLLISSISVIMMISLPIVKWLKANGFGTGMSFLIGIPCAVITFALVAYILIKISNKYLESSDGK